jgi:hypothetical protein
MRLETNVEQDLAARGTKKFSHKEAQESTKRAVCSKLGVLTAPPKGEDAMKQLVAVCLSVLMAVSAVAAGAKVETFALADQVGEPDARAFFLFSTSAGNYIVRQDGMGEFASPKGMRRVFYLKLGAKGRIDRVYFLEHERDLFLLYTVHDATSEWSYLTRMEQIQRKARWLTPVAGGEIQAPVIDGDWVTIGTTTISKANGNIRQD